MKVLLSLINFLITFLLEVCLKVIYHDTVSLIPITKCHERRSHTFNFAFNSGLKCPKQLIAVDVLILAIVS